MHPDDGVGEVKDELFPEKLIIRREEDSDGSGIFIAHESVDELYDQDGVEIAYYERTGRGEVKVNTEITVTKSD